MTWPFSWRHEASSATWPRSIMAAGRRRPKFRSTIRSVPPAIGVASGRSAFIASASSSECGSRTSMTVQLLYPRRRRPDPSEQGARAEDQVLIGGVLQRRVAHPADAGDEEHAGRDVAREDGGIVTRAAPQPGRLTAKLLAGRLEQLHLLAVHPHGWQPGEPLGLGAAAFLGADRLEIGIEGLDDSIHDRLLEVTYLERKGGTARNDVDAAGIELHGPDVRHRLRIDVLHQLAHTRGCSRGGPTGVVA